MLDQCKKSQKAYSYISRVETLEHDLSDKILVGKKINIKSTNDNVKNKNSPLVCFWHCFVASHRFPI